MKTDETRLLFDAGRFTVRTSVVDGRTIRYRAYENIPYVSRPVNPENQVLNIYIPEAYFSGGSVGGFTAETAPVFLLNQISAYKPAVPVVPAEEASVSADGGHANAAAVALARGYVVASPGARGSTSEAGGRFTGKAPAAIVDLKAAVRYLRFNDARMPGSAEKIVSDGTSAGGALSALLGASGKNRICGKPARRRRGTTSWPPSASARSRTWNMRTWPTNGCSTGSWTTRTPPAIRCTVSPNTRNGCPKN